MKVFILSAGRKYMPVRDYQVPTIFLELSKGLTIIENIYNKLLDLGISSSNISVVIDESEVWRKEYLEKLELINLAVFVTSNRIPNNNIKTILELLDSLDDDVLLIDGDLIVEKIHLENLINSNSEISVLAQKKYSAFEKGVQILFRDGNIYEINRTSNPEDISNYNYKFTGVTKLRKTVIRDFKRVLLNSNKSFYIEAVNELIHNVQINLISIEFNNDINGNNNQLVGGSFANLEIIKIVRKSSDFRGIVKLRNEITWLNDLNIDLRKFFPSILNYQINSDNGFYDMPLYEFPNLRDLIRDKTIRINSIVDFIKKLILFMKENVYSINTGYGGSGYIFNFHFKRFFERTNQLQKEHGLFKEILSYETININGINTLIYLN